VLGKRMEDHLRFAVCYWHSFVWEGTDPFGGETFQRPWHAAGGDPMQLARMKADVAFDLFTLLRAPFFTFHDRDIAPEGATLRQSNANVRRIGEVFEKKMTATGVKLLWARPTSFRTGASCPALPPIRSRGVRLRCCAGQNVLELTHELKGENYVLWAAAKATRRSSIQYQARAGAARPLHAHGGRAQAQDRLQGFDPDRAQPGEPTKHQYDYDVATCSVFSRRMGWRRRSRFNIEQNHALLARHTFEHEISLAQALGIFGSIDMNRGDEMLAGTPTSFRTTCRRWRSRCTTSSRAAASPRAA